MALCLRLTSHPSAFLLTEVTASPGAGHSGLGQTPPSHVRAMADSHGAAAHCPDVLFAPPVPQPRPRHPTSLSPQSCLLGASGGLSPAMGGFSAGPMSLSTMRSPSLHVLSWFSSSFLGSSPPSVTSTRQAGVGAEPPPLGEKAGRALTVLTTTADRSAGPPLSAAAALPLPPEGSGGLCEGPRAGLASP